MEAKDREVSGSPGKPDTGSPGHLPQVTKFNVGNSGGPTPPAPTTTTGTGGSLDLTFGKKKRGRPRKYDSEGKLRVTQQSSPSGLSLIPGSASKRGDGRWPHASNLLASLGMFAGTTGSGFTPHVVTVYAGEDVARKIYSFARKGPLGMCILSANGAISKVALRQPGSCAGTLTYEGRFEILSLSGSFTVSENGGISSTAGLSVSLAGPDGRVIGGSVAGLLTASGPIQSVMGSFMPYVQKTHKRKQHGEHTAAYRTSGVLEKTVAAARPISQQIPCGENLLRPSPHLLEQGQRESVSVRSNKLNLDDTLNGDDWNGTDDFSDHRPSPNINISLSDE